jgi:hypothetical protein
MCRKAFRSFIGSYNRYCWHETNSTNATGNKMNASPLTPRQINAILAGWSAVFVVIVWIAG